MRKGNEISAKEMAVLHISNRPCPLYPRWPAGRAAGRTCLSLALAHERTHPSHARVFINRLLVRDSRLTFPSTGDAATPSSSSSSSGWRHSAREASDHRWKSALRRGDGGGARTIIHFFLLTPEKEKIHFLLLLDSYVALPLTVSLYFFLSLSLSDDWPEVSVCRWLLRCLVRCFSPSASLPLSLLFFFSFLDDPFSTSFSRQLPSGGRRLHCSNDERRIPCHFPDSDRPFATILFQDLKVADIRFQFVQH